MVHASTHRVHPLDQSLSVYITTMSDPIDVRYVYRYQELGTGYLVTRSVKGQCYISKSN
jgi:hypothetical protein